MELELDSAVPAAGTATLAHKKQPVQCAAGTMIDARVTAVKDNASMQTMLCQIRCLMYDRQSCRLAFNKMQQTYVSTCMHSRQGGQDSKGGHASKGWHGQRE